MPIDNGWRVYVRLANSPTTATEAGSRSTGDGKIVDRADFTIHSRRTSKVKSVVFRGGDVLIGGIGEADSGEGFGGDFALGSLVRC